MGCTSSTAPRDVARRDLFHCTPIAAVHDAGRDHMTLLTTRVVRGLERLRRV